jgi:hypothetical protein
MATETITIDVDAETAQAFKAATSEESRKLQLFLRLRLRDLTASPSKPLGLVMNEIGQRAKERGLTPAILESLLHE